MKAWAWGAIGAVVALAVAFWIGRLTVPDRTAEVIQWRTVADSVGKEAAAAEVRADSAEAHVAGAVARADSAARRVAAVQIQTSRRDSAIAVLRDSLDSATTAADSVPILSTIVLQQDTVIQHLRAGVRDAADALAGLHTDLAVARETLHTANTEAARLRAVIAAGLEVTRPSRGRGTTAKALALGVLVGAFAWEVAR